MFVVVQYLVYQKFLKKKEYSLLTLFKNFFVNKSCSMEKY